MRSSVTKAGPTNDPMEAHYIGFNMWVQAVEAAGTTDVDAVRDAMYGIQVPNLTGGIAEMLPNHHLTKPVLIGEIRADGQFDIISQTEPVPGDAWTDFLAESAVLESDWPGLGCGMLQHRDADLRADRIELLILSRDRVAPDRGHPPFSCRAAPYHDPSSSRRDAGPVPFCSPLRSMRRRKTPKLATFNPCCRRRPIWWPMPSRRTVQQVLDTLIASDLPEVPTLLSRWQARGVVPAAAATACSSTVADAGANPLTLIDIDSGAEIGTATSREVAQAAPEPRGARR